MEHADASAASLTIAFATAAGIISQSFARKISVPGIVVLLAVGVLLGPDVAGVIHPKTLGAALPQLISFAVAVILFEGGMHLKAANFRRRSTSIRRLITWGALITMLGGTLTAKLVLGWDWRTSALFGALVIVTGPTVVSPLVRRFRLTQSVRTILEAEGVLIDAVGAVIAVVALEIALEPSGIEFAKGVVGLGARLGFGTVAGLVGGLALWFLLRYRGFVAEGLENVFTLALVWALFQASEAVIHESGIAAVTVAGLVVGNLKVARQRELLEFKDQLTVMLIGMLFVLLAANVSLAEVYALGAPGIIAVFILILVVRPVTVLLSTHGTGLSLSKRLFIAWIGPRGIIAAAVASLFASELDRAGIDGGGKLSAMVFLVIAITVPLAGLTGGVLARALSITAPPKGWLLLGANEVAGTLADCLKKAGQEVTCIDSSADAIDAARSRGLDVVQGNGLDDELLHRLALDMREGVAALTPNDEVNLLFIQKAKTLGKVKRLFSLLRSSGSGATTEMVKKAGGELLFGRESDVELWSSLLRADEAAAVEMVAGAEAEFNRSSGPNARNALALFWQRKTVGAPVTGQTRLAPGDRVTFLYKREHQQAILARLEAQGWALVPKRPSLPARRSSRPRLQDALTTDRSASVPNATPENAESGGTPIPNETAPVPGARPVAANAAAESGGTPQPSTPQHTAGAPKLTRSERQSPANEREKPQTSEDSES